MNEVDRQLRHDLEDLSAPGDPSGVVDRVLRRAARRHARRTAGRWLLAIFVVVFSITAFVALLRVFPSPSSDAAVAAQNGLIVFSDYRIVGHHKDGSQILDGWYLYTIDPANGRLTRIGPDVVTEALFPTWSPDGERVAFLGYARDASRPRSSVYVANVDGAGMTEIFHVPHDQQVEGLHWSPDGTRIGYQLASPEPNLIPGVPSYTIWSMASDGTDHRQITTSGREMHFAWSPDGETIVVERFEPVAEMRELATTAFDLFVVDVDDGAEFRLTDDGVSRYPAWSPDGSEIAFSRGASGDSHVATVWVDGTGLREFESASTNEGGVVFPHGNTVMWSPDATMIAFAGRSVDEDVCSISALSVDGGTIRTVVSSPSQLGCPGQEGMSWAPAMEPVSSENDPTTAPSPDPSLSPDRNDESNTTEPQDIGIAFRVCFAERLGGIDHLGDGTNGNAWTAVSVKEDGTCPRYPSPERYLLAVDYTGDRVADSWIDLPIEWCASCAPWDAADLDANGTEELIIASYFSIMDYYFFSVRPDASGAIRVEPILVASPGHEPARILPGEPLRIDAGGDAGYSSTIECEDYPSEPTIVWSWSYWVIETDQPQEVHVTRLELQPDGLFHVVHTSDFSVPADTPSGVGLQTELGRQCGVDWYR